MGFRVAQLDNDGEKHIHKFIKEGIPEKIRCLTIYSSDNYLDYLKNSCIAAGHIKEIILLGVYENDSLVGYAEWRHYAAALFLNNIYVLESKRGKGLGELLLKAGINLARQFDIGEIGLDVFDENRRAAALYSRLGFHEVYRTDWYVGDNPAANCCNRADNIIVEDFTKAEAYQRNYGFSYFKLITAIGNYVIGRIGTCYYRITDIQGIDDMDMFKALHNIDPGRRILLLLSNQRINNTHNFQKICTNIRMKYILQ